jgi:hypothetical protein
VLVTLDGENLFGVALTFVHVPAASALQVNSFFGVLGTQTIDGGTRGRTFQIGGLFYGPSVASIWEAVNTLETYADGVPRTLAVAYSDGGTFSWVNVIYANEWQASGRPWQEVYTGMFTMEYKMVLRGLT